MTYCTCMSCINILKEEIMKKKDKKEEYDYYKLIKSDAVYIFEKYNLSRFISDDVNKEFFKNIYLEKLYNLMVDISNQEIYDYKYNFKKEDVDFIMNFELDKIMYEIINMLSIRIKQEKKNKVEYYK